MSHPYDWTPEEERANALHTESLSQAEYFSAACREYGRNAGMDDPEREWILTPFDTWERNPFYRGKPGRHPEDDGYEEEEREACLDAMEARGGPAYYFRGVDDVIPF